MEPIYQKEFEIDDSRVDCFGAMKPSQILYVAQEMGGEHSALMSLDYDTLAKRRLFWAVTRHRVQITRMPRRGETIRVETWPMPTTRVAYPRSVVAYDADGRECFRAISLWVLMDLDTRNMILPGKSGITVTGTVRGTELAIPNGLIPRQLASDTDRSVCFTDLDRNGHMNNTRYLDWIEDLFPSSFHREHSLKEFTVCYLAEARESQRLTMHYGVPEEGCIQVDAERREGEESYRVFAARLLFE